MTKYLFLKADFAGHKSRPQAGPPERRDRRQAAAAAERPLRLSQEPQPSPRGGSGDAHNKTKSGRKPREEDRDMTRYLFLKMDLSGHKSAPKRTLDNAGIDVKLLPLLSARYV